MAAPQAVIDAVSGLLAPLLETLERVGWVQRHLYPPLVSRLADELAPQREAVAAPLRILEEVAWPDDLVFMRDRLADVAHQTIDLVAAFVEAARSSGDLIDVFRAVRRFARVQETLYPLAPAFDPVSRWFLEPSRRDDDALVVSLRAGALREDDEQAKGADAPLGLPRQATGAPRRVGVLHARNERDSRGGFTLYVPEQWDGQTSMPLVVALHGGHGHGRDFLWSWLRDARSRGVLVLAPTSADRTWSIMGGADVDAPALVRMFESVASRYPIDRARVLLTGMSDGATYALLCGLYDGMPFTHLAPLCGVLHPLLLTGDGLARAHDRPVYLVHGALDWMFPVHTARIAREALETAGARVVYREIDDLSHTYPRDENPRILDWLAGDATA